MGLKATTPIFLGRHSRHSRNVTGAANYCLFAETFFRQFFCRLSAICTLSEFRAISGEGFEQSELEGLCKNGQQQLRPILITVNDGGSL